ncbi:MAG: DNA-directed RNA polymerase subunit omega [Acidobacteria bacterium]|nr:DNA-directed RNA polymerase subunit omega [Acidobacteriota bacterium]
MAVFQEPPLSKFVYVIVASRRARQLQSGARPLVDLPRARKHTRIAMEELDKALLEYELPVTAEGAEEKEGRRRKT